MSALGLYLEQITRPSWWLEGGAPGSGGKQPTAPEKRAAVLACLKAAGRPVGQAWVEDYTGYTKQSVNHLLGCLVESGAARRVEGWTVLLWEAR